MSQSLSVSEMLSHLLAIVILSKTMFYRRKKWCSKFSPDAASEEGNQAKEDAKKKCQEMIAFFWKKEMIVSQQIQTGSIYESSCIWGEIMYFFPQGSHHLKQITHQMALTRNKTIWSNNIEKIVLLLLSNSLVHSLPQV